MAFLVTPNGFETGDASQAQTTSGTFSVVSSPTAGAWSNYSLRVNPTTSGTGSYTIRGVASTTGASVNFSATTLYVKFKFRIDTLPAANSEEFFRTGGTTSGFFLRVNSSGNILLYSPNTTLCATGSAVLSTGVWYTIQIKVFVDGVDAKVSWLVDGVADITNASTLNTADTTLTSFVLGKINNRNSQSVDYYFDDIEASDSAYPDINSRVSLLIPVANGTYQTWSIGVGSGSHYQVVDDVPPNGDTDYLLSTIVSGDVETESLGGAPTSISGTVTAVSSVAIVKSNTAGLGSVRTSFYSGSTLTGTSGSRAPSSSTYECIQAIYETDPNTSAAWTVSAISSIESGCKNMSTTVSTRMTFTGANVAWYPDAVAGQPTMRRFSQCRGFRPVGIGSEGVTIG